MTSKLITHYEQLKWQHMEEANQVHQNKAHIRSNNNHEYWEVHYNEAPVSSSLVLQNGKKRNKKDCNYWSPTMYIVSHQARLQITNSMSAYDTRELNED
jgi:hypothetical protein